MKKTLSFVAVALLLGTAACSADGITGPQRAPGGATRDGIGWLGGGGRAAVSAQPRGRVVVVP